MYKVTITLLLIALPLSAWRAHDLPTWWLEITPILLALPCLWSFGRRGLLSPFLQIIILVHASVLMMGGHYTYALTPLGEWIKNLGIGERNNYDKLGHFLQGLTPALVVREILLRMGNWKRHPVFFGSLAVLAAGGISAIYEVLEMLAALALGSGADAFLGTQGYIWDTQTDMATALVGALFGVFLLPARHARSLQAQC